MRGWEIKQRKQLGLCRYVIFLTARKSVLSCSPVCCVIYFPRLLSQFFSWSGLQWEVLAERPKGRRREARILLPIVCFWWASHGWLQLPAGGPLCGSSSCFYALTTVPFLMVLLAHCTSSSLGCLIPLGFFSSL